jgi:hypothetical protein
MRIGEGVGVKLLFLEQLRGHYAAQWEHYSHCSQFLVQMVWGDDGTVEWMRG